MVRSAFIADGKDSALYIQGVGALRLALIVRVNTGYFSDYATAAFEKSYAVMGIFLGLGILLVFLSLKVTYLPLHALTKRITKRILSPGTSFRRSDAHSMKRVAKRSCWKQRLATIKPW